MCVVLNWCHPVVWYYERGHMFQHAPDRYDESSYIKTDASAERGAVREDTRCNVHLWISSVNVSLRDTLNAAITASRSHSRQAIKIITPGSGRGCPSRPIHSSAARNKSDVKCCTYSFPPTRCDESEHARPVWNSSTLILHANVYCFCFLNVCNFYNHQQRLRKDFFLFLITPIFRREFISLWDGQRIFLCKVADFLKLLTRPLGTAWMIHGYLKVTLFSQFTFLSQRVFKKNASLSAA